MRLSARLEAMAADARASSDADHSRYWLGLETAYTTASRLVVGLERRLAALDPNLLTELEQSIPERELDSSTGES